MVFNDSLLEHLISNFIAAWRRLHALQLIGAIILIYFSSQLLRLIVIKRELRLRLETKRKHLEDARLRLRDRVQTNLPPTMLMQLSALEIHNRLQSREISALEALHVYQKKVLDVLDCNAVCDVIEDAEAIAKSMSLDLHSPICGLPVSIKENISIAGYDSTVGLISRVLSPVTKDSPLIQVLRSVGAVPFVSTTMSPTGLCLDASTVIFGKQRNPHDVRRLAGGSSSGEAVLIAKGASPLGFGTDIAGSVRLPSACCGICALKPTTYRVSTMGVNSVSQSGCIALRPVFGPMAKHTQLLIDAMRAILTPVMFDLDPRTSPLPFRDDVFLSTKPLVIGFLTNLGGDIAIKSVPSVENAIYRAKTILQVKGHRLVDFQVPQPDKLVRLVTACILADGGANLRKVTQWEPANPRFRRTRFLLGIPALLRRACGWFVSTVFSRSIGAGIYMSTGCQTPSEMFNVLREVGEYQVEFAEAWAAARIDVLLCPALPFPAPLESTPDPLIVGAVAFTSTYNLLDYPAGVIPVSKVSASDVEASKQMETKYREAGDWLNATHARLQSDTEGLPVTVQVVGKPLDEETVLRVMKDIEDGVLSM